MNKAILALGLSFFMLVGLSSNAQRVKYMPIGDDYSYGQCISPRETFPYLLNKKLKAQGFDIAITKNLSETGFGTEKVISRQLPTVVEEKPNFVTVEVGYNDWIRGVSEKQFERNYAYILDQLLEVVPSNRNILAITIPDFAVTPIGQMYDSQNISLRGVDNFNQVIKKLCRDRGIDVADIYHLSRDMKYDRFLICRDGLHPTSPEYREWVDKVIYPLAVRAVTYL